MSLYYYIILLQIGITKLCPIVNFITIIIKVVHGQDLGFDNNVFHGKIHSFM